MHFRCVYCFVPHGGSSLCCALGSVFLPAWVVLDGRRLHDAGFLLLSLLLSRLFILLPIFYTCLHILMSSSVCFEDCLDGVEL